MRRLAVAAAVAAGCAHPPPTVPTAPPGRSVAIFVSDQAVSPELAAAMRTIRARIRQDGGRPPAPAGPDALAFVDDRRWIDLPASGELVLPELAPGAQLDSVVIEPLGAPGAVAVVGCARPPTSTGAVGRGGGASPGAALIGRRVSITFTGGGGAAGVVRSADDDGLWLDEDGHRVRVDRARIVRLHVAVPAGVDVRCRVRGRPGRHLVRIAYVTTGVTWRAVHQIDATLAAGGTGWATVRSGFRIAAPGWSGRADVSLCRGLPGPSAPPARVWAGALDLDTEVAVAAPPRRVPVHVVDVYRGAVTGGLEAPTDPYWRTTSQSGVYAWLVVDAPLEPGAAVVTTGATAGPRRVAGPVERDGDRARIALWRERALRGLRVKTALHGDHLGLRERLSYSIANSGDAPREVWIEEELRPARRRRVRSGRPRFDRHGDWIRARVTVPAGGLARARAQIDYEF
jgi:hypothetical protein